MKGPTSRVECTVGIWIPTFWIPETFQYWTFWSSDFKMVRYSNGQSEAMSYVLDQTSANNLAWYFRRPKILDEVSFWGFSRSVKIEIFITLYGHPSVMQPIFDHSYTRRDWYSDPHCILFHFQIRKSSCRQMSNSVIGMNRCEACAKEVPKLSVSDFNNFQIRKRLDPPPPALTPQTEFNWKKETVGSKLVNNSTGHHYSKISL